jgi:ABC-type dipeptide/oligopeptide/nickel transport system permease subunit
VAGYLDGAADDALMRAIDALQTFPTPTLARTISAALGPRPLQRDDRDLLGPDRRRNGIDAHRVILRHAEGPPNLRKPARASP